MLSQSKQIELMRLVIGEVEIAIEKGDNPYACLLVDEDGKIMFMGRNMQNTSGDKTAHAEIVLIREATKGLHKNNLSEFAVICNSEPCSMCISALIKVGVNTIYYGAPMDKGNNPFIRAEEIAKKSTFPVTIIGGILTKECMDQVFKVRKKSF